MPETYVAVLSVLVYAALLYGLLRYKRWWRILAWPEHPTLRVMWVLWLGFLLVVTPLTYHERDMMNWVDGINSQLQGTLLPEGYVYLPIYAQLHAALLYPIHLFGLDKFTIVVVLIHLLIITAYAFAAGWMVELSPKDKQLAPLATVLAPTTIFFIFFGTNHVVMWALLAAALVLLTQEKYALAGFAAFAGGYKLLLLPVSATLLVFVFNRKGRKKALSYLTGGLVFLLLNVPYYLFDRERLRLLWTARGSTGSYATHLDAFHLFHLIGARAPSFETWFLEKHIWLYVIGLISLVAVVLYVLKRINTLQGLAFVYAAVALLAPEPLRLEPLLGLLWLDSIAREDRISQGSVVLVALVYAAFWFQQAYPQILTLAPYSGIVLHAPARGLYVGGAVLLAVIVSLGSKKRGEFLLLET